MTSPELEKDLVTRKMGLIAADINQIANLMASVTDKARNELSMERLMERIIGRMIDINYHLIVASRGLAPSDYFASFLDLGRLGILDAEFAADIARSAGLRNRLAHEYDDIDPDKVLAAAVKALKDVPRYLKAIEEHISRV